MIYRTAKIAAVQDMRTFAQTYEHLESQQVMRVPFTGTAKPDQDHARGNPGGTASGHCKLLST